MLKTYRIRFVKMLCIAVLTSLIFPLSSCQGEDDEPVGKGKTFSELFSERSISFGASASTKTIYGNGNLFDYEFSTSASWLSVSGYSSQQLFVSVTTNSSSYTRSGYVNVYKKSGGLFGQIQVTQQGSVNSGNQGNDQSNNNNQGGNNQGNDNQGGDNQGGNNQGGNNQGGGSSVTKPSAPSGVRVANEGSIYVPSIVVRWSEVSGATSYNIYRSTARDYGYSKIGTSQYNVYSDNGRLSMGSTYYYKVTAVNSAGESEKSSYAEFVYADERKPGAPQYGNCTVSNGQMTIRWTIPSGSQDGTPTKHILRVQNPQSGQWADIQTLSGTATSASFAYGMWLNSDRRVYVGIIAENDYGTATRGAIIYDENTKKWYIP